MVLLKELLTLEAKSGWEDQDEIFVASDGTKHTAALSALRSFGQKYTGSTLPPDLVQEYNGMYGKPVKPRTDADRTEAKRRLDTLEADIKGYRAFMSLNMNPYRKDKEQMLKNADKVLAACRVIEEHLDEYNEAIFKINELVKSTADNARAWSSISAKMRNICAPLGTARGAIVTQMRLPQFVKKFRMFAVTKLGRMLDARDRLEVNAKRAAMSPKRRAAAKKASDRMRHGYWAE